MAGRDNIGSKSGVPAKYDPNRLPNGHFKKGNNTRLNSGEDGKRFHELRTAYYSCVTDQDMVDVVTELKKLCLGAKSEDVKFRAQVYFLDRLLGRPTERVQMDVKSDVVAPPIVRLSEEEKAVLDKLIGRTESETIIDVDTKELPAGEFVEEGS